MLPSARNYRKEMKVNRLGRSKTKVVTYLQVRRRMAYGGVKREDGSMPLRLYRILLSCDDTVEDHILAKFKYFLDKLLMALGKGPLLLHCDQARTRSVTFVCLLAIYLGYEYQSVLRYILYERGAGGPPTGYTDRCLGNQAAVVPPGLVTTQTAVGRGEGPRARQVFH